MTPRHSIELPLVKFPFTSVICAVFFGVLGVSIFIPTELLAETPKYLALHESYPLSLWPQNGAPSLKSGCGDSRQSDWWVFRVTESKKSSSAQSKTNYVRVEPIFALNDDYVAKCTVSPQLFAIAGRAFYIPRKNVQRQSAKIKKLKHPCLKKHKDKGIATKALSYGPGRGRHIPKGYINFWQTERADVTKYKGEVQNNPLILPFESLYAGASSEKVCVNADKWLRSVSKKQSACPNNLPPLCFLNSSADNQTTGVVTGGIKTGRGKAGSGYGFGKPTSNDSKPKKAPRNQEDITKAFQKAIKETESQKRSKETTD